MALQEEEKAEVARGAVRVLQQKISGLISIMLWRLGRPFASEKGLTPEMHKERRIIVRSGAFDSRWYLHQYPDVRKAKVDPLLHFLRFGAQERRNPHPAFDTGWYLSQYPDIRAAGVNPFAHYLGVGAAEGRSPNPELMADAPSLEAFLALGRAGAPGDSAAAREEPEEDEADAGRVYANADRWYSEDNPDLSIIILNWNKSALTKRCLRALWEHTAGLFYEIVVVDNGSRSAEAERLAAMLAAVGGARFRLIRLQVNRFFGEGNNIGVEQARGRYIVFLNNDAFATPGWLEPLVETLEQDAGVGAVGPKFVFPDGRLQEAGALIEANGVARQLGRGGDPADPQFNRPRDVHYCSAACLLMRKSVFEQALGFDLCWEPAYYEDSDLCLKIILMGLRIRYCPQSTIVHIENATSGDRSHDLKLGNIVELNRIKFVQRWGGWLAAGGPEDGPIRLVPARTRPRGSAEKRPAKRAAPRPAAAIYTPYSLIPGGGERYLLTIAEALQARHAVTLLTPDPYSRLRLLTLAREFGLDLEEIALATPPGAGEDSAGRAPEPRFDLFIAMANEIAPPLAGLGRRNLFHCQFPFPAPPAELQRRARFWDGYEQIIVNSGFTRWHALRSLREAGLSARPVRVIAPPVDLIGPGAAGPSPDAGAGSLAKTSSIIHVGRFFAGGHCKRQDFLITSFRALLPKLDRNAELHLAGALHPEARHRDYLLGLQEMAKDLPVRFHINESPEALARLYRQSAVYWHATGVGADPDLEPEKCEHFGISVVEAMSAGCVPVVYDKGGPAEVVEHGRTGFHFSSAEDLVDCTRRLLVDREAPWVAQVATAAVQRASEFAKENFIRSWAELADGDPAP